MWYVIMYFYPIGLPLCFYLCGWNHTSILTQEFYMSMAKTDINHLPRVVLFGFIKKNRILPHFKGKTGSFDFDRGRGSRIISIHTYK